MSSVVVWLTTGGTVEYVASPDVDVVMIDFQDLEAGDPAPTLSEAHKALLKSLAPSVMDDIATYCTQRVQRFVVEELTRLGWVSDRLLPEVLSKAYATAVGPRSATIRADPVVDDECVVLSGAYWSEGRNALDPCITSIPSCADRESVVDAVMQFLAETERTIVGTYAAKLLRRVHS